MNHVMRLLLVLLLGLGLALAATHQADAARLGGGKSFGSRPSYSAPAPKPAPGSSYQGSGAQGQQGMAGQTQTGQRPGMFGGLFGGLLAGTLLGSLFGGFGGFGGLFPLMLLLGVGWMLLRMFSQRREAQGASARARSTIRSEATGPTYDARRQAAESGWDRLRSEPAAHARADERPAVAMPAGFDPEDFLKGAKVVFTRLQESWDARDLADIREFTSPEVYAEIARQAAADPGPSRTDILMVEARLLEVKENAGKTVATVFYDVLLREDPKSDQSTQVREVWHFVRDAADSSAMWRLEGIQQLAQ